MEMAIEIRARFPTCFAKTLASSGNMSSNWVHRSLKTRHPRGGTASVTSGSQNKPRRILCLQGACSKHYYLKTVNCRRLEVSVSRYHHTTSPFTGLAISQWVTRWSILQRRWLIGMFATSNTQGKVFLKKHWIHSILIRHKVKQVAHGRLMVQIAKKRMDGISQMFASGCISYIQYTALCSGSWMGTIIELDWTLLSHSQGALY